MDPARIGFATISSNIISSVVGSQIGEPVYVEDVIGCYYIIYFPIYASSGAQFDVEIQKKLEEKFPSNLFGEGTQTFVSYGITNVQLAVTKSK